VIESHTIMDGKVHVHRRERSRFWQCAVFLSGRNHRQTTRQENAALAIEFARDWYLDRVAEDRMRRRGMMPALPNVPVEPPPPRQAKPGEMTFKEAATTFVREYEAMTQGERNAAYVSSKGRILRLYLLPFFGELPLSEVTAGRIQEYRVHRVTQPERLPAARYKAGGREFIGKAPTSTRSPRNAGRAWR